jgi:Flp pilus assembly pilin Flp
VPMTGTRGVWRRLLDDESGQDIIEYALLAGFVALASLPALGAIQSALRSAYLGWNSAMDRCWQMPEPGHGGGC